MRDESPENKANGQVASESFYCEVQASLVRLARRFFKSSHEVEDVVQEAFVKVIEAQQQRNISYPKSYIYQTVKNLALSRINNSDYRLTDTVGDFQSTEVYYATASLEDEFESRQKLELFCRAVRELPVKCQRAYILRKVYGFSQKEIAERMGVSPKTVESHLTKAIMRCTNYMKEHDEIAVDHHQLQKKQDQSFR